MAENMVRTQVYLPRATYAALQARAEKQGLTMAMQIRAALDEYLRKARDDDEGVILQPDDPLFKMVGIFDSGLSDVAVNHDHYLYGMPNAFRAIREQKPATHKPRAPRSVRRRTSAR